MSENEIGRRDLFKRAATVTAGLGLAGGAAHARTPDAVKIAEKLNTVPTKALGASGAQIPILLMGCSQKFDPVYDKMLHRAYQEGVTYLDTAQAYANGMSHKTLAPFIEQVGRENVWVTSKVALRGATAMPQLYEKYLEKIWPVLRTDYLDMFFMHTVDQARQLDPEFIKMGERLKSSGKAKLFGFSCHQGNVVELMNKAASIGAPGIDAIMFRYNFTRYGDMELNKAMDACKAAGIGLIAMKTQASVPEDGAKVQGFTSKDYTLFQAKLKAVWADDRIDAAVSEMTNVQQVRDNTDAAKTLTQLSMRDFHELNRYAAQTAHLRCQGCNEICESQVRGDLKIAETLRYLMYAECYGKVGRARELYRELTGTERAFDATSLAAATRACPQGIDIARRLGDAQRVLA